MNIRASNGQYSKGSGHEWVKTMETCHIVVLLGLTCTACKQEYRGMSVHIGPALLQAASKGTISCMVAGLLSKPDGPLYWYL